MALEVPGAPVTLVSSERCDDAYAVFRFTRPASYVARPGQYLALRVGAPEGVEHRFFSHVDAPHDEFIEVGTRISASAFKQTLASMRPGDRAWVDGPFGRFGLAPDAPRTVFLTGGIGVTPVIGILRDAAATRPGLEVIVVHGNPTGVCRPYAEELDRLATRMPRLRVVPVIEHPQAGAASERGLVTAGLVARVVDLDREWAWAVSGPPGMVTAMRQVLDALAVDPGQVTYESFTGY